MYIHNNYLSMGYKFFYLTICGYGIYLNFYPDNFKNAAHMFSYFTIQCNIFCFIVFFILMLNAYFTIRYNHSTLTKYFHHIYGMALLSIIITFLTFHFVLNNSGFSMLKDTTFNAAITENDIYVHYLVPALTILDWLLFEPKGYYKWYDPLIFLIPSVFYLVVTFVRCEVFNNSYPYSFLNLASVGMTKGGKFLITFIAVCLIIGYIILAFDYVLKKRRCHTK